MSLDIKQPKLVVVHPLVLLSVVDHYDRTIKGVRNKRVMGILLGKTSAGTLDVTNCFAIPFEEDPREKSVWFLDHLYLEKMGHMFHRVNFKEKIVGWYITGTQFKSHDIEIHELMRNYCKNPVLV